MPPLHTKLKFPQAFCMCTRKRTDNGSGQMNKNGEMDVKAINWKTDLLEQKKTWKSFHSFYYLSSPVSSQ